MYLYVYTHINIHIFIIYVLELWWLFLFCVLSLHCSTDFTQREPDGASSTAKFSLTVHKSNSDGCQQYQTPV